jgi:hypothetical protein
MKLLHLATPATQPESNDAPLAKPKITEYSELVTRIIPEPVYKSMSMKQLKRRCAEVDREMPHMREETSLLKKVEKRRRTILSGPFLLRA